MSYDSLSPNVSLKRLPTRTIRGRQLWRVRFHQTGLTYIAEYAPYHKSVTLRTMTDRVVRDPVMIEIARDAILSAS